MKKHVQSGLVVLVIAMVGVATNASAQEQSRAEVTQDLAQQVAHLKQQSDGSEGPAMSGSSDSGKPMKTADAVRSHGGMDACVGPAGFCTPYFGS